MFKEKFEKSVRFKFLVVMSGILFISTVVLSSVIAINERKMLMHSLTTKGQKFASYIAKLSIDPLIMKDSIQLDSFVNEAHKDEDILYIVIHDAQGNPITSQYASINYQSPRLKTILPELSKDSELPDIIAAIKKKEAVAELSTPILSGIHTIGKVTIGMTQHNVRKEIVKTILFVVALNIVLAFILGVVLFIVSRKIILDPISELANAASRLARGDLSTQVKVKTTGEVQMLVNSFNQMVHDLQKTTVSQKSLQTILDSMPFGVTIIDKDKKIQSLNNAALALTGYKSEEELIGMICNKTFCPAEEGKCPIFDLGQKIDSSEKILVTKEGRRIPILKTVIPIELHGKEVLLEAFIDITERKQAEKALVSAKARLQHLLISSPAVIYSTKPDADMVFTFISNNIKDQIGYDSKEFIEDPEFWISHVHTDDTDRITAGLKRLLSRGHHIHEYRFRHKDGAYLWLRDEMRLIYDDKGNPLEIVGYWIDITERKHAEEQLSHRAFYDQLTNLPNRALFIERLQVLIKQKKRYNQYLYAVLFMDVDRFKIINDSLGHLIGDQLLIIVAQRLKKSVRAIDTVARLGGDEFAILLEDLKEKTDIYTVINRIQNEMNLPFLLSGHEIFSTISIGIAIADTSQYLNPEEILRDADTAMYYAKSRGTACYVLFDPEMHVHAVKVLQIETDLRRAIERKEFVLDYQPIVSMKDNNNIIGFEALVRWQHPERGPIPPNDFIPLAEETGLIVPIGHWVLREACRQMHEWQEKYPDYQNLTISVNISTKEFAQPNFVLLIEKVLQETGLNPTSLKLEITENMIIGNYDYASTVFQKLRKLNVEIQIDDFGTGHSALNYMLHLPIDALKIDRSFVRKAATNEDVKKVVKTIIALAHTLKMDVIAEGVETMTEMELFKNMKSEYAQGFYFSKPMDSKKVESQIFSVKPKTFSSIE